MKLFDSKYRNLDVEIIRLYNTGLSTREIAQRLEVGRDVSWYRLKVNGVERRPTGHNIGKKWSFKQREALMKWHNRKDQWGKNNPNWKNGNSIIERRVYKSKEYKIWRKAVYERDSYVCQACGKVGRGNLEAHHILPKSVYPHLVFAINNGITLCSDCHRKMPHDMCHIKDNIGKNRLSDFYKNCKNKGEGIFR